MAEQNSDVMNELRAAAYISEDIVENFERDVQLSETGVTATLFRSANLSRRRNFNHQRDCSGFPKCQRICSRWATVEDSLAQLPKIHCRGGSSIGPRGPGPPPPPQPYCFCSIATGMRRMRHNQLVGGILYYTHARAKQLIC